MTGERTVKTSLLCLCVALLSARSEAQITRPELKSISAPAYAAGNGIQLTEAIANDLATLKVDMVRVEFIGESDAARSICYTAYDRIVDRLAARQIEVLGLIDYQSIAWASSADWTTDAFRQSFVARVQEIVGHYRSRANPIRHWEIWNEEDICVSGYCPYIPPEPYGRILVDVYEAIEALDPGATVVLGGISPKGFEYSSNYLSDVYGTAALQAYRGTHGHSPFDVVGVHPYPEVFTAPNPGLANVLDNRVKAIMNANGDAARKVWLTEMGWNSSQVSEANQASYLTQSYQMMDTHVDPAYPGNGPYVERYFWFCYADFGTVDFWGLKRADLSTAKPAYGSYNALGPSSVTKPIPPPEGSMPGLSRESASNPLMLSIQPDSADPLNGIVATRISGGFHPANTNPADHEPAFTDGAGLGALTGLLMDYPGQNTPAWSGFWVLAGGTRVNLSEVRVFSGNAGKDGRVFHHYDLYATGDPAPSAASTWAQVRQEVTSAPFGTSNASGSIQAMLTRLTDPGGGFLATGITALRVDFYAVSRNDDSFHDDWDACTGDDCDGAGAAFQSPLVYEVDGYYALQPQADLSITKVRTSPSPAVPGGSITYRMTVTNGGPGTLTSVTVRDPLPAEILVPAYAPSAGSYDSATGTWTGLSLAPSQSITLDLTGTIDPSARGTLVNTVFVEPPAGVGDPDPTDDSATVSDTLSPSADLGVSKTADAEPAALGGLLTYTLTVTNHGLSAATGVVLTDPIPPPTEFDSAATSQGTCSFDGSTRVLTCPLGDMPCPGTATVTLRVRPMALGTLTNTASVDGAELDPVSSNDSATRATTVQVPSDGVPFFTVTSTSETNVLEWLNPSASYAATEILVRTDRFPTAPGEPGTASIYSGGTAGARVRLPHPTGAGSNGQTFYYAAFVHLAPSGLSAGRFVRGRPFDTSGAVKWAFSTGGFSVTPPTVGGAGVVATSNDMVVHAMARGAAGGEWPAGWLPFRVGGPVQTRSPVVPITVGAANPVVFLGSQDGRVYALDGTQGGAAPSPWALGPTDLAKPVQAAPAGIFSAFGGGLNNYLLVGTRDASADNRFVALDPADGSMDGSFDNGGGANGIGIVNGMASVDYGTGRAYFASHARTTGAPTLWCVQLPLSPGLAPCAGGWTPRALGDIDSSPVLRGGRVYVGSAAGGGTVYSIDPTGLAPDRAFVHGDGQVKGFVTPDRSSDHVYFATDNKVWAFSDTESGLAENFPPGGLTLLDGPKPSAVLFVPGSHYLYVGASNGRLYQVDLTDLAQTWIPLGDGKAVVGAPSFDRVSGLIHVGTEAGVFYAVQVPLP